jgi:hypothetical protein
MLDVASTLSTNEFTNGPYSLIEPLLPTTHAARKSAQSYKNNLAANASLVLKVEFDPARLSALRNSSGGTITSLSNVNQAVNIAEALVVKGYKYPAGWTPESGSNPVMVPVTLPDTAIGAANSTISAINATSGKLRAETYQVGSWNSSGSYYPVTSGLHDPRLGRPVEPITINMSKLKQVMEANPTTLSGYEADFRNEFKIKHASTTIVDPDWNGIVYVEFPTSLNVNSAKVNTKNGITTYAFDHGSAELRHPDRNSEVDGRANRADKIVTIAPELRRYPPNGNN